MHVYVWFTSSLPVHHRFNMQFKFTMAYIAAKVWIKMHATDKSNLFFDVSRGKFKSSVSAVSADLDKREDKTSADHDIEQSELFLDWFSKAAFSACVQSFKNTRSKRHKSIWLPDTDQMVLAKQSRSKTRKKKVYKCSASLV